MYSLTHIHWTHGLRSWSYRQSRSENQQCPRNDFKAIGENGEEHVGSNRLNACIFTQAKQILGGIGERRNISESVRRNLPLPSPQEPSSPPALAPSRESSPLAEEEGKRDCQETSYRCGEGMHPLVSAGSLACRSTRPCPAWSLEQRDSPRCTLRYLSVKREGGLVGEKEFGSTLARSSRPFV